MEGNGKVGASGRAPGYNAPVLQCPLCIESLPAQDPDLGLVPCAGCGVSVVNPDAARLDVSGENRPGEPTLIEVAGALASRYHITYRIGAGAMGAVFEAFDRDLSRSVAIKFLCEPGAPSAMDRFRREGQMMARLSHPNVVKVYDSGEVQGIPYLVTELVTGGGLDLFISRRGPIPMDEALGLMSGILEGLQECHDQGILHRDLKPANILLDGAGRPKIGDLGLAVHRTREDARRSITQDGMIVGTIRYLAPEVLAGEDESPASDLYSVGLILHEMLEGRRLHAEAGLADLILMRQQVLKDPGRVVGDLPAAMRAAVLAPLAPAASDRPRSAREWAAALKRGVAVLPESRETPARGQGTAVIRDAGSRGPARVGSLAPTVEWPRAPRGSWRAPAVLIFVTGCLALGMLGTRPGRVPVAGSGTGPAAGPMSVEAPPVDLRGRDGSLMVLISGGVLRRRAQLEEGSPVFEVVLGDFYLDRNEVTNQQFARFLHEAKRPPPPPMISHPDVALPNHPVMSLTWEEADAYCRWAGKELPTEAQWEHAARGSGGGGMAWRSYPWGDDLASPGSRANFRDRTWNVVERGLPPGAGDALYENLPDDGWPFTAPVGRFRPGASAAGVDDLAGNVAEWCRDWFDSRYYNVAPRRDPPGPTAGKERVIRGGSYKDRFEELRSDARSSAAPSSRLEQMGMRCACTVEVGRELAAGVGSR